MTTTSIRLEAISKKNINGISNIKDIPAWFDIKNYHLANRLDLEAWIIQLYLRQTIQGFLLPITLTGVVDDYQPNLSPETDSSTEAIQPLFLQDALLITEALKNSVHIPPELWQAPSHFAFFEQSDHITDTPSILSWFRKNSAKGKLPSENSYLTEQTNSHLLRSFWRADLTTPDSVLLASFKRWLANERKLIARQKVPQFSKATLQRWAVNQVLPYIDLTYWTHLKGQQIPCWLMGKILFPEYSQADTTDRVRKTTEKIAKEIMTNSCLQAMGAQLAAQTGKNLNVNIFLNELEDLPTKYKVHV